MTVDAQNEVEPEAREDIELDSAWSTFHSDWLAAALGVPSVLLRIYAGSRTCPEMVAVATIASRGDGSPEAGGLALGYFEGVEGVADAYFKCLIAVASGLRGETIAWPSPSREKLVSKGQAS